MTSSWGNQSQTPFDGFSIGALPLLIMYVYLLPVWYTIFNYTNPKMPPEEIAQKIHKYTLYSIVIIVIVGIVSIIPIVGFLQSIDPIEQTMIQTDTPIYSVHRENSIKGSFFLGCGGVKSYTEYYMYVQASNGGMQLFSVPTHRTTIFEDEETNPYLTTFTERRMHSKTGTLDDHTYGEPKYEIHVPKGTVREEFILT